MARTTSVATLVMLVLAAAGAAFADVGRYKVLSFRFGGGCGYPKGCPNDCGLTCIKAGLRASKNGAGETICTDDLFNEVCATGAPLAALFHRTCRWHLKQFVSIVAGQTKQGQTCGVAPNDFSCCCST